MDKNCQAIFDNSFFINAGIRANEIFEECDNQTDEGYNVRSYRKDNEEPNGQT